MDDLIDRLLNWRDDTVVMEVGQSADDVQSLMTKAAEEIEDLRRELAEANAKLAGRLVAYCVCKDQQSPADGCDCVCCTTARLERELAEARGLLREAREEMTAQYDAEDALVFARRIDAFLAADKPSVSS